MGFNGVRKHQKIEDPRYLYWADRLGLLVWEEMPSAYRFTKRSIQRLTREWMEAIAPRLQPPVHHRLGAVQRVLGRAEPAGQPGASATGCSALYHLTKTLDPTRPVIGNDGWESVATDIIGIHDYDADAGAAREALPRRGRAAAAAQAASAPAGGSWCSRSTRSGTSRSCSPSSAASPHPRHEGDLGVLARRRASEELAARYRELLDVGALAHLFSGFCYTQFADTYQEANGLLRADRTRSSRWRRSPPRRAGGAAGPGDPMRRSAAPDRHEPHAPDGREADREGVRM